MMWEGVYIFASKRGTILNRIQFLKLKTLERIQIFNHLNNKNYDSNYQFSITRI